MTLASASIAESPILGDGAGTASSSSVGVMAPLSGYGTQGAQAFRGESFRATETQWSFRARDGKEMLGVTDKWSWDKIWYECDFIDVLRGASILTFNPATGVGSIAMLSHELVSNGEAVHKVRVLLSAGTVNTTESFYFRVSCSDGSYITRRLKIRIKEP